MEFVYEDLIEGFEPVSPLNSLLFEETTNLFFWGGVSVRDFKKWFYISIFLKLFSFGFKIVIFYKNHNLKIWILKLFAFPLGSLWVPPVESRKFQILNHNLNFEKLLPFVFRLKESLWIITIICGDLPLGQEASERPPHE